MASLLHKNGRRTRAVAGIASWFAACALLHGCAASSDPWLWTRSQPPPHPGVSGSRVQRHDPSVLVFASAGTSVQTEALAGRRDSLLAAGARAESLPDRLAWPAPDRLSLNRTRSVSLSRSPDRWVYPTRQRDQSRYNDHHQYQHRAWGYRWYP